MSTPKLPSANPALRSVIAQARVAGFERLLPLTSYKVSVPKTKTKADAYLRKDVVGVIDTVAQVAFQAAVREIKSAVFQRIGDLGHGLFYTHAEMLFDKFSMTESEIMRAIKATEKPGPVPRPPAFGTRDAGQPAETTANSQR